MLLYAILLLTSSFYLQNCDGACTLPSDLRGKWHASDIGVVVFNSTHMTTYNSVSLFGTKTVECYDVSDGRYLLVSGSFYYFNSLFQLGFCWEFEPISPTKYVYYAAVGVLPNTTNTRLVFKVDGSSFNASTDCTLSAPYDPWVTRIMIKDGYSDVEAVSCPDNILGKYNYTVTSATGSTCFGNSTLDVCSNPAAMTFDYSECSTTQGYSASGSLYCVNYTTVGDYDYLITYNRDPASILDEAIYHRYTCYVITNDTSDPNIRHMTQYPQACMDIQTPTHYITSGAYAQLIYEGTCENITIPAEPTTPSPTSEPLPASTSVSSANVFIAAAIAAVILIIIIIIVIVVCIKKKFKSNSVYPDEYIVPPIKVLLKMAVEANKVDKSLKRSDSQVTFTKFDLENDTASTTAILSSREILATTDECSTSRDNILNMNGINGNSVPQESKHIDITEEVTENKTDLYKENPQLNEESKKVVTNKEMYDISPPINEEKDQEVNKTDLCEGSPQMNKESVQEVNKTDLHEDSSKMNKQEVNKTDSISEEKNKNSYNYVDQDQKEYMFDATIESTPQIYTEEEIGTNKQSEDIEIDHSLVQESNCVISSTIIDSEIPLNTEKDETKNVTENATNDLSEIDNELMEQNNYPIENTNGTELDIIQEENPIEFLEDVTNNFENIEDKDSTPNIISIPS